MNYSIELDKYELNILKSLAKEEYKNLSVKCEDSIGFDRDMLEDSKFKLLMLIGKLDNVIMVVDKEK